MVTITNAVYSTTVFIFILLAFLLASLRKKNKTDGIFSPEDTQELKGFAIIAIILAHVGYILVSDNRFLQPYSYFAGMGVDIFLILSGFGLTVSMLRNRQTIVEFYQKRFKKLYIPMWASLVFAYALSYLLLSRTFDIPYILRSVGGLFTTANAFQDINSPLWYFTFILFYYLLFPFIFSKKFPWITSILYFALGYFLTMQKITLFENVIGVYRLHIVAFPLGILFAWVMEKKETIVNSISMWLKMMEKSKRATKVIRVFYALLLTALLYFVFYFGVHSGVGKGWRIEEAYSILTAVLMISFVVLKNFKIKLFSLFGTYSYEIYLTHWPIAYVLGVIWRTFPAWGAMLLYMVIVIVSGVLLQIITSQKPKLSGK